MGPKNVAGPVVRGSDFWGRDQEVDDLWRLLAQGSVLLTGPRRHGKSSLMYAVNDNPKPGFSVVLIDVEWVETPEQFLTTMAAELLSSDRIRRAIRAVRGSPSALLRWISGIIDEVGVGAGNVGELRIRLREKLTGSQEWQELASDMLEILRGLPERTVLILDEFPMMVGNMLDVDEATALRFLRWFRTFRQSPRTGQLSFLLGGSINIEPRLEEIGSEALLGDLQRYRIMPFAPGHAVEFVAEILNQEGCSYEDRLPESIVSTCGSGVPYYLQVIVAECIADGRRSNASLTAAKIQPIYEEHVIGPINRHRFSHYHTRLRRYGDFENPARVVLGHLTGGPKTLTDLAERLVAFGDRPDLLEPLLVRLEADYYVNRDGEVVSFSDGLLRDWWKRNSVPPRMK